MEADYLDKAADLAETERQTRIKEALSRKVKRPDAVGKCLNPACGDTFEEDSDQLADKPKRLFCDRHCAEEYELYKNRGKV